ncbi:MAG: hypothetical protein WAM44_19875 [Chthoniobacterales bacterium]
MNPRTKINYPQINADYADFALGLVHAADQWKPLSYAQVSSTLM